MIFTTTYMKKSLKFQLQCASVFNGMRTTEVGCSRAIDIWVHEDFADYNTETLTKIYGQKIIAVVVCRGPLHTTAIYTRILLKKNCSKNHCPHTVEKIVAVVKKRCRVYGR